MSKSLAANLALVFMVLWTIALVGAMSTTVWEPGPAPQPMRDPPISGLWAGTSQLSLVGAAWLAGFACSSHKVGSMLALALGAMLASWKLLLVLYPYSL